MKAGRSCSRRLTPSSDTATSGAASPSSRGNAFVSPEWFAAWNRQFGRESSARGRGGPRRGGEVLGLLPVSLSRRGALRTARIAGSRYGDWMHPACEPGHDAAIVQSAIDELDRHRLPWGAFVLENVDVAAAWTRTAFTDGRGRRLLRRPRLHRCPPVRAPGGPHLRRVPEGPLVELSQAVVAVRPAAGATGDDRAPPDRDHGRRARRRRRDVLSPAPRALGRSGRFVARGRRGARVPPRFRPRGIRARLVAAADPGGRRRADRRLLRLAASAAVTPSTRPASTRRGASSASGWSCTGG